MCAAVTGEQSSKDNTPYELTDRAEEDAHSPQISAPPVVKTTKKSSKSSGSQQKRPKAKKESNKVLTTTGPQSTNRKNSRKGEAVSKTNKRMSKRQIEPEQIDAVCEENDSVEPLPALDHHEEEERTGVFFHFLQYIVNY